jgi:hypothetical protein
MDHGGAEYSTYYKKTAHQLDWSHPAKDLLYKTCYGWSDRGKDRSAWKMRNKT